MPARPDHLAHTIQRHGSVALKRHASADEVIDPFNTDEWDPARGAFWQHAVAGSVAGVAEHSLMFPIDTMKTHMQVRSASPATIFELVAACGVPRLWRGVQTMFAGCIPAHAAYFSIYETFKPSFTNGLQRLSLAAHVDALIAKLEDSDADVRRAVVEVPMA